jgi:thymidine phosphorylase
MRKSTLHLRKLGINTHKEAVIYMRKDCDICKSEGFETHARLRVTLGDRSVIATLNTIDSDFLEHDKAGLSNCAF